MTEIFLTKMILNPKCPQVRRDLGNPQELHRTVSKGFPEIENQENLKHHEQTTPRNKFNILHRLEVDKHRGRAVLLVQSTVNPDWSFLPADYADELRQRSVHEQYGRIENGMTLMFRLQANPTKRIGNSDQIAHERFKDKKNRRRVELRTDEERIKWLKRKGEEVGFQLANIKVSPIPNVASVEEGKINFRKEKNSPKITFGSVVFYGVLVVTDEVKFKESIISGIGTGKAYGFGLLSIAKSQDV